MLAAGEEYEKARGCLPEQHGNGGSRRSVAPDPPFVEPECLAWRELALDGRKFDR